MRKALPQVRALLPDESHEPRTTVVAADNKEREAVIWDLLDTVIDPCHVLSGHDISILDLGLVNSVRCEGREASISITLTEVSCVLGWRIIEQIESLAAEVSEVDSIAVKVDPFPIWTPDRMSERGRAYHASRRQAFHRAQVVPVAAVSIGDHP